MIPLAQLLFQFFTDFQAGNYMFKVSNRNTKPRCEVCSELTIKTPERRQWLRSGVFIINFEHISHLALVFPLLTLSRQIPAGSSPQSYAPYIQVVFKFTHCTVSCDDVRKKSPRKNPPREGSGVGLGLGQGQDQVYGLGGFFPTEFFPRTIYRETF